MNSSVVSLINTPQFELKYIYGALISAYVLFVVYVSSKGNFVTGSEANDIKIWVMAGALASLMGIVSFFLKRLLETFEKKTEQLQDKLSSHHEQLVRIFEKHDFHGQRISNLEKRLDTRKD